jgi:phosphatidylglycerophosphate synthase
MKKIPILLIYSRVLIGCIIVWLSVRQVAYSRAIIIALIAVGLLTDIFDGIIARRMGISTEKLRRLDSGIDQVFWLMVLAGACIISPAFYEHHIGQIIIVLSLEGLAYLLCFFRFRKEVATHAILSKIWTLTIFATIIQAIATGNTGWTFDLCYYLGIITRIEIMLIILLIPQWTNDVPSVYHAVLLRQGKLIKRNKWFNG